MFPSLRSDKVATPPCAAYAAIPCGLAVRKQHEMLFAASKFDFENPTKRRSIIMKRKLVMLLTIVAVLAVGIGIWYNVPINLMDLEHDEVIEIVVFNGNTGNATHITDETQIEHIIENLNEIKLKRSKPSVGYSGYVFNAVPTTDWGSPETLEHWREAWAELCNAKFAEKGLDVRIDHRSYERQGVELLPTVHEGATVRAMEKKGIRTEKGEFNRWIKATNAVIRDIKKKITSLMGWIADMKAELAKPQAPDLVSLLNAYYTQRKAGTYSQKGKISNLKEMNDTFNYLRANGIYSLEDLERRVSEHSAATESLKKTLDEQTARMKAIKRLYDSSAAFQRLKPVYDGLQKIKFEKPRSKYKAEHEAELIQFYAARRKLTGEFPDGKVDMKKLSDEYDELEQAHETTYGEFKAVRDDLHRLWKVKSCVDTAARFNERTEEQKLQNRPQTRHKKEELSR